MGSKAEEKENKLEKPKYPDIPDDASPKQISEIMRKYHDELDAYHEKKLQGELASRDENTKKAEFERQKAEETKRVSEFAKSKKDFKDLLPGITKYYKDKGNSIEDAYRLAYADKHGKLPSEREEKEEKPSRSSSSGNKGGRPASLKIEDEEGSGDTDKTEKPKSIREAAKANLDKILEEKGVEMLP